MHTSLLSGSLQLGKVNLQLMSAAAAETKEDAASYMSPLTNTNELSSLSHDDARCCRVMFL